MALDDSAELICQCIFNWVHDIVADFDAPHVKSIDRCHDVDILKGDFVDYQVDGDILDGFRSNQALEADVEPAAILVFGFDRSCAYELESSEVPEIGSREPLQFFERCVE